MEVIYFLVFVHQGTFLQVAAKEGNITSHDGHDTNYKFNIVWESMREANTCGKNGLHVPMVQYMHIHFVLHFLQGSNIMRLAVRYPFGKITLLYNSCNVTHASMPIYH